MMYFSRITIKQDAVKSGEFLREWSNAGEGPYQIHKMVWRLYSNPYSNDLKRDFLYRVDLNSGRPVIYTVSEREPLDQFKVLNIETKPYDPQISNGMVLGFTLRANPVITKTTIIQKDGKSKKKLSRHDVIMDAKWRIREESGKDAGAVNMSKLIQQEGFRWLKSRSERCGFSIDPEEDFEKGSEDESKKVRVDAYTQHNFMKDAKERYMDAKKGKISLSTIDYNGVLTVTDKEKFLEALSKGIGPAKGFGCGLMMIKRI